MGFPLRLDRKEPGGIVHDGVLGVLAQSGPSLVSKPGQFGGLFSCANIAGNQVRLIERDVEAGLIVVFDFEDFFAPVRSVLRLDATKFADAIVDVNDQVTVVVFPQGFDLLADLSFPSETVASLSPLVLIAAKNFGIAEHCDSGIRNGESPTECADDRLEESVVPGVLKKEFGEAFLFSIREEDHQHRPVVLTPLGDLGIEFLSLGFLEDKVTGAEFAERVVEKGTPVILRAAPGFESAAGQTDVSQLRFTLCGDDEIFFANVIRDST